MIKVDYAQYTLAELEEAKLQTTPDSQNYPALMAELSARQEKTSPCEQLQENSVFNSAEMRVKFIGYMQLLAALVMTVGLFVGPFVSWWSLISLPFIVLSAAAGYTAISEQVRWYWLSILNQGLQLVSFSFGVLNYKYTGLGAIQIGFTWLTESKLSFGILFSSTVRVTGHADALSENAVHIDVLALVFIVALLTVKKRQQ
ncbi:hypothetical protein [Pseudoalteromonas rubra]|uniref:Uncharacterized protein n=1 Tax=Pseudoalteromonas rubra TaxID=43658 RepID=A0A0F4QHP9_9GAMM|nr:hypothetical protein [Pseudoalteromonas rubra]KJZ06854.1 hypothetical protein TW77_17680 [Pseudoalteromonas rubra]